MIIENNDSVYSIDDHMPYATINFIKEYAGEDMIVNVGSKLGAEAKIKVITRQFKNVLSQETLKNAFSYMEFLIATNKEWRREFLRGVASVIYDEYNTEKDLQTSALEFITTSPMLSINKFVSIKKYDYRVGY